MAVLRMPRILGGGDVTKTVPHYGLGHAPDVPSTEEIDRVRWELAQQEREPTLDELARAIETVQRRIVTINASIANEMAALKEETEALSALQGKLREKIEPLVK
jgi:hypothetical protein